MNEPCFCTPKFFPQICGQIWVLKNFERFRSFEHFTREKSSIIIFKHHFAKLANVSLDQGDVPAIIIF